ncbi:MAG: dephospho-CoA kinase, partial [Gemmatimonadetes bacterium]|nr:dephospho-CoA kinase [Gemmatimonadota bacterium]
GSGKSTVARAIARRGARVLDADQIVRALYEGGELPERLAAEFGAAVRHPDGSVDRKALGAIVFSDPEARRKLEAMVHPAVRAFVLSHLDEWRAEGFDGIVVLDAALLVESDFAYPLDALLVVTAPREVRLERLEGRGVPREEAVRRMDAQAGDDEKRSRADAVLDNGGDLEDLEREVTRVLRELGRDDGSGSG